MKNSNCNYLTYINDINELDINTPKYIYGTSSFELEKNEHENNINNDYNENNSPYYIINKDTQFNNRYNNSNNSSSNNKNDNNLNYIHNNNYLPYIKTNSNYSYNDSDDIDELTEKILKLRLNLKIEEQKVQNQENMIKRLNESIKANEEKCINLSREFNDRKSELKIKYKMNEEENYKKNNIKEKYNENNINNMNKKINNLEYENMKLNLEISEYKNRNNQIESQFDVNIKNINDNLLEKSSEFQALQEEMELLQQEIINKEEEYEQRKKNLNIKLMKLKEENSNKIELVKNNLNKINKNIIDIENKRKYNLNKALNKTLNNFHSNNNNNDMIKDNIENDNYNYNYNNISYLRECIKILHKKTVELSRTLSLKYDEGEELNNEITNLKEKIKNNKKNKNKNKNNLNYLNRVSKGNNVNKIVEMKMMINSYKNIFSNIKMELNNKIIEHKLHKNELIISYEKKIKKLIEKINNLKNLKNDYYQITDDITDNLFDDN